MNSHKIRSLLHRARTNFIGDRAFYNAVIALVIPIIVQNTISNFVNLLDNIMVGQVGTVQMSGVAIANQLIFVFNLTIFGGLAGAGIFGAQFFGARNLEGFRHTIRFKLWSSFIILVVAFIIFLTSSDTLISFYLTGEGSVAEAAQMLHYGREYLRIMLLGLIPFSLSQVYASTLRETGESILPMKAGIIAVLTNLCLNYVLIYGKLGLPALGIAGAAIATVISRYVEFVIIVVYTHRHAERFTFIKGLYKSMKVPLDLVNTIAKKGMPLLVNELLWSMGMTTLTQIYSTCSLTVIAGINISGTVSNVFNVVFISMGTAVAVMAGQALGAGDIEKAKSHVWKLIFFSVSACIVIGGILIVVAPFIPLIYKTTDEVRNMATHFMRTGAVFMAFHAISHCCYFALRSGGRTVITFVFDSLYLWCVCVPFTYILTHYTNLSIYTIYPISSIPDALKSVIGILIVRTGSWAQNVVENSSTVISPIKAATEVDK